MSLHRVKMAEDKDGQDQEDQGDQEMKGSA